MRVPTWLVPTCALTLACASTPDGTAWRMATEANTPAAYRDFATRYPTSEYAETARARIAQAQQSQAEKASSVAECVSLLKEGAAGRGSATLADAAYRAAMADPTPEAQVLFLQYFGAHPGAPQVRARLESLEMERALRDGTPEALQSFLLYFPASSQAGKVQAVLEEKAYAVARQRGTQIAYRTFVAWFPRSPRAAEVRSMIRAGTARPGGSTVQASLDSSLAESRFLQLYACILHLSKAIRESPGAPDEPRRMLFELDRKGAVEGLPPSCVNAGLQARPGMEADLAEALAGFAPLDGLRREQATLLAALRQRGELTRSAGAASKALADELETAELSEQVLASGALGGIDLGPDKGSQSARRAYEQFEVLQKVLDRDASELSRMLTESNGSYQDVRLYVMGCVDAR